MRSRPIVTSVPLPLVPTDLDTDDDADELLLLQPPPHTTTVSIPIPPIDFDHAYYQRFPYPPYTPPLHYIKFHLSTPASLYSAYDHYDLLHEDVEWLQSFNAEQERQRSATAVATGSGGGGGVGGGGGGADSVDGKQPPTLTEDSMEALMDLFEKDAGVITVRGELMSSDEKVDVSRSYTLAKAIMSAATTLHLKGKPVELVYHYWIDKRKRRGKALLRIFQEPPPKGNTDPHVAFRPRLEGRRISKRNPRKDDISAYHKMLTLKKDFVRVLDIVEGVVTRERDKRDVHLLDVQIFDQRLALSHHAQRLAQTGALTGLMVDNPLQGLMAAAPPAVAAVSLFRSTLPPCTWVRPEKKKAKKAGKPSLPSHPPALTSSASTGSASSKSGGRAKAKSSSKKGEPQPLSSPSPSSLSSLSSSPSSLSHPDLYDDAADFTSDDDFLSEDDDDRAFFHSIDLYTKRQRLPPLPPSSPSPSPYLYTSIEVAFPDDEILPPSELITPPPGVPAVLGRCRGRVGRGGKLWIDPVMYLSAGRRGGLGLKVEGVGTRGGEAGSLHSEMDHASATSFSPYPSAGGDEGMAVGVGAGGAADSVQPMAVEYQQTPANIKEMQQVGQGGAAMVDVVDMPVPIAAAQ